MLVGLVQGMLSSSHVLIYIERSQYLMRVNWGCSPDVTREYRDIKHPLPSPSSPSPLIQIQQCPCGLAPLGLVQSSNSNSDGLVAAPVAAREDLPVAVNPPSENLC